MLLLSTIVFQWTAKVPSLLLHRTNRTYTSMLTFLVTDVVTVYLSNLTMLKLQLKHFSITGLSNLVHQYILSLIVDQNILTPIIRHSPRTPYSLWTNGHVEGSKQKPRYTYSYVFYKTLPRIEHIKFICTLLHTTHNPFQHSRSHLMK